jgi:ornithine cyclodeaminase
LLAELRRDSRSATARATHYCAVPAARTLALIGTGELALQQLLGVCAVRPIRFVRLYGRSPASARRFVARAHARGVRVLQFAACASPEQAVRGADVVCTATTCARPLIDAAQLAPHVHINCMGAHTSESREVARELLAQATLIVEDRATAVEQAGQVHERALELAELAALAPGRLQRALTVFSSTGHAFLDLISAAYRQQLKRANPILGL